MVTLYNYTHKNFWEWCGFNDLMSFELPSSEH